MYYNHISYYYAFPLTHEGARTMIAVFNAHVKAGLRTRSHPRKRLPNTPFHPSVVQCQWHNACNP